MEWILQNQESLRPGRTFEFAIEHGDITTFEADVLALKYAQSFFGADLTVATILARYGYEWEGFQLEVDDYRLLDSKGSLGVKQVLFVGVPSLMKFLYKEIREFVGQVMIILSQLAPATRHVALTLHGIGTGLDEVAVLEAEFIGLLRAQLPEGLEKVTIVDQNPYLVQHLRRTFDQIYGKADFISPIKGRWAYHVNVPLSQRQGQTGNQVSSPTSVSLAVERAVESEKKPHAFVALPFCQEMEDVFEFGIRKPVRAAGLLCEKSDQEAFTGDILEHIKKRIETAALVIAELTGANPNVYLEVGYAWGRGRPTILLVKTPQDLRFDVQGHRCLTYDLIKDLGKKLKKELKELKTKGLI
jgi:hypothetical protein